MNQLGKTYEEVTMIATDHQTKKKDRLLVVVDYKRFSFTRTGCGCSRRGGNYFPLRNLSQILIVDIVSNKTADKADDKRSNDFDHDYHLLRRESLAGGVQRQSHYVNPHPTKSRVLPSF